MVARELLKVLRHVGYEDVIGLRRVTDVRDGDTGPFLSDVHMPLHEVRQLFLLLFLQALFAPTSRRHRTAIRRNQLVELGASPTIAVNCAHQRHGPFMLSLLIRDDIEGVGFLLRYVMDIGNSTYFLSRIKAVIAGCHNWSGHFLLLLLNVTIVLHLHVHRTGCSWSGRLRH